MTRATAPLAVFHPAVRDWFSAAFEGPTRAQRLGWPAIARGESTLILAPTGSGKTLTAFLWCLNRLLFEPVPDAQARCRVLYVSPLKALAVDVERNLRAPLVGISNVAAAAGTPVAETAIAIRTGDTPANERARFQRTPADILITTPESLFLLLTSRARERLVSVDTVIIDEIHALVPGKRGAHLALSLERLEALRAARDPERRPLQRIGLSATQRPLDEVARYLGGATDEAGLKTGGDVRRGRASARPEADIEASLHDEFGDALPPRQYRPVTIVDASDRKPLQIRVEVPVEDMGSLGRPVAVPARAPSGVEGSGPASQRPARVSIWASIYPRLLELIRSHRSTLLFVNSRRLAERLAGALNDLAEEPLVRSHHGSLAREARSEVEDLLKAGRIRALVATSSLELGIDMGAIDLVVQIESPPSVASGLQRIGRAGHQVGAASEGVIFPKFRGDLVACAAVARAMHEGAVESTRYPRNPLDVLAQQLVAIAGLDPWNVDDLYRLVRRAAPFADLGRRMFDGVLDMLSGRYPSDEFAELRPRVTWDRVKNTVVGREGAVRVAIANAGTIPDRGLYGVFLAGAERPTRVGELDEEMVFETEVGDTFTLGASTWRVEDITHDRVLVSPAPGEPGKMPFWHGDQAGRPVELGLAIGKLVRELGDTPKPAAVTRLTEHHGLDRLAAENVLQYLDEQRAAGGVPDDRTLVIERCLDELGDWRVCVLSPLGSRIHAPWAMAVTALVRNRTGVDVEVMWGDEGFVVRFPETEQPPDPQLMLPDADEVEGLVLRQLGSTSLFAARFRETAARALLLPRRRAGQRTPLFLQRKKASDLLAVAARFGSFPMMLETYREVLRDHFDMPGLVDVLRQTGTRARRVMTIDSTQPSPFAASLLFNYVANYIYDGDAPLAERRAQALSVDQAQLRELLGDAELRDLLDPGALEDVERRLQQREDGYQARGADGIHDLLLRIGDLTLDEILERSSFGGAADAVADLARDRRIVLLPVGGQPRYVAVEDVARYRDALGVPVPPGLPESLLEPVRDAVGDLVMRFARSHGPFAAGQVAARYGLGIAVVASVLQRLTGAERLIEGEFRPGGTDREWVDANVLRSLRSRSRAKLRHEIEAVEGDALGRFMVAWHGLGSKRRGLEALLDAVEQLQGAAVPASVLERDILPVRVDDYAPAMLDTLLAAGEVVWVGVERLGDKDGRIALYLTDQLTRLRPPATAPPTLDGRVKAVRDYLASHGASFFAAIREGTGQGFPADTVEALWELVWMGLVTNDSLHPLRTYTGASETRRIRRPSPAQFRSRRSSPRTSEGRWSLVETAPTAATATEWGAATAHQLLTRYGIVTRETVSSEAVAGGFSAVYQVLRAMEDTGRIRRGYFVAGLGGAQFAMPAALDLLRSHREPSETSQSVVLAATDPANPYGTLLKWPEASNAGDSQTPSDVGRGATRTVGALVVLVDGLAAGYLRRGERDLLLALPGIEPARSRVAQALVRALIQLALARPEGQRGLFLETINGTRAGLHPAARWFVAEGFVVGADGLQYRATHQTGREIGSRNA